MGVRSRLRWRLELRPGHSPTPQYRTVPPSLHNKNNNNNNKINTNSQRSACQGFVVQSVFYQLKVCTKFLSTHSTHSLTNTQRRHFDSSGSLHTHRHTYIYKTIYMHTYIHDGYDTTDVMHERDTSL